MDQNTTAARGPLFASIDVWASNAVCILIVLSILIGLPGNILVVLVHINIVRKTVTDWMIFYLAVSDIMSLLSGPMFILQAQGYKGFPDIVCKLYYVDSSSVSMAAYMFCACTALERYFKVVLSKEMLSYNQARFMWVPVVLVSFGIGSIMFWAVKTKANGYCVYDGNVKYLVLTEYILITTVTVISSIIMAVCYIRVGVFLIGKMKEISKNGNKESFMKNYENTIQTTKMLTIVTVVFFISSNVPYSLGIVISINSPKTEPAMSIIYFFANIVFINNFFNPILYMIMSETFRNRSKDIVRYCCCRSKYELSEARSTTTPDTTK